MKLGRIEFGGKRDRADAGQAMRAMFDAGYNNVTELHRLRAALRRIIEVEHYTDEQDVSHHWHEGMTDPHCPGCIAIEALAGVVAKGEDG